MFYTIPQESCEVCVVIIADEICICFKSTQIVLCCGSYCFSLFSLALWWIHLSILLHVSRHLLSPWVSLSFLPTLSWSPRLLVPLQGTSLFMPSRTCRSRHWEIHPATGQVDNGVFRHLIWFSFDRGSFSRLAVLESILLCCIFSLVSKICVQMPKTKDQKDIYTNQATLGTSTREPGGSWWSEEYLQCNLPLWFTVWKKGVETWPLPKAYSFVLWAHLELWMYGLRLVVAHGVSSFAAQCSLRHVLNSC